MYCYAESFDSVIKRNANMKISSLDYMDIQRYVVSINREIELDAVHRNKHA